MAATYVLVVGVYASPAEALADLRDMTSPGASAGGVVGVGVLRVGAQGWVLEQPGGGTLAYNIGTGAAAGVAVGALLGLPLVGLATGAVLGVVIGVRSSRAEAAELVRLLGDAIPPGATALLAVSDERQLLEVRGRLGRALRTTGRVLAGGPLTDLARALVRGNPMAIEALDRQASGPS